MEIFEIETARLRLRKITKNDLENFSKLFGDPDVMQFSLNGSCLRGRCKKILEKMLADEKKHGIGIFVVLNKQTNEWMGIIGVTWSEKVSVVYRFFKRFWNQGFATEALRGFVQFFQNRFPHEKIYVYVHEENIGSVKVAEKTNMRFVQKTTLHNQPVLEYVLEPKSLN